MTPLFEELDYRATPMGPISLRRRRVLSLGEDVFEVMLGDEHLMSSLFTETERALARLALARVEGDALEVAVGGLGLGYTAQAALADPRVSSLVVIEIMEAVIDWHRQGLVPLGAELSRDPRCRFVQADFFAALAQDPAVLDPETPARRFDAVLLDVDHAPDRVLSPAHAALYAPEGLARARRALKPGGVFALWSDDPPDTAFMSALQTAFAWRDAEEVAFDNPLTEGRSSCTIYLAGA